MDWEVSSSNGFVAGHPKGRVLMTQQALVICHNQSLVSKCDLRGVLVSTHAILFFGTPHSGFEGATLAEAINHLASVYIQTTDVILKDLRSHSSELENIHVSIERLWVFSTRHVVWHCLPLFTSFVASRSV